MLDGDAHQIVLRLRQISDGEQVVHLEIGNDNGGAVFQDLLGLGGNAPSAGTISLMRSYSWPRN